MVLVETRGGFAQIADNQLVLLVSLAAKSPLNIAPLPPPDPHPANSPTQLPSPPLKF